MSAIPTPTANAIGADIINSEQGYQDEGVAAVDALHVQNRYGEERARRLRDDGDNQFVDISLDEKFQSFLRDPWVDTAAVKDIGSMFTTDRCQLLILGAGWGGLLYAIRMVQAGVRPEDIRIIDSAGGFGGTWYWNRYPGLGCDVESYLYLPLLEETGYIPRHRFSSGEEIRSYANLAAEKWGLNNSAVFQTKAEKLAWNEESKEWHVELSQQRTDEQPKTLKVSAQFVATVNGVLNWPKLPAVPGILDFQGGVFHSSRWDYGLTGGSPTDPSLTKLQGKRVAIVGTGATSVQTIPHLARWAKQLYVVQRTPAAVDHRGQRETDLEWFGKNVATSAGWQRERYRNFHQHFNTKEQPAIDLVNDGWTNAAKGMVVIAGNPAGPKTMDELPAYMQELLAIDLPRQDRVRRRVEQEVKNPDVAKKLQAWYPTWCKRPAFHDEYLSTFNRENVTLVDTEGKGADRITADSIVAGDESYPVDVIICATGFRAPFTGTPAEKANITILGRNGVSMSKEWARTGPSTQHGVLDHNFPNLFLAGPWQASLSPSNLFSTDVLAKHAAYILTEAKRRANGKPFAVAPTAAAAEDWGTQVMMRSPPMAAIAGCTPSYFNVEGGIDRAPPEMQMIMARSGVLGVMVSRILTESWKRGAKRVVCRVLRCKCRAAFER